VARELKPCGTPAAYRRHLRYGQDACQACLDAEAARRRPEGNPPRIPAQHGTPSKYASGCRCADCTEAHRVDHDEWRRAVADLPAVFVPHGIGGYNNYGCRCAVCFAAKREANAVYAEFCRTHKPERRERERAR